MDIGHYQNVQLDSTVRDPILGPILWEHPHPRAFSLHVNRLYDKFKKATECVRAQPLNLECQVQTSNRIGNDP
jgi:hypothetical protein